MIGRRAFLLAGAALALTPGGALADVDERLSFSDQHEQGSLVIGRTLPGAKITVDDAAVSVSPGGLFTFGIAYDRTAPVHVAAAYADGTGETRDIAPVIRQYLVQSINGLPQGLVTPSPENLARIKRENELIYKARTRDTGGVGFAQAFDWPFPGIISSVYGSRRIENGTPMAPHLGIDIAAPEGTPIHAPADAVVSIADDYFLDGGFTLLDHGHGVSTCYLHQSKRMVAVDDKVKRGQVIGLVGQTGRATGPHTHWGLCWFQLKLDPSRSTVTPEPPKA